MERLADIVAALLRPPFFPKLSVISLFLAECGACVIAIKAGLFAESVTMLFKVLNLPLLLATISPTLLLAVVLFVVSIALGTAALFLVLQTSRGSSLVLVRLLHGLGAVLGCYGERGEGGSSQ
jgi:hypothetical protein